MTEFKIYVACVNGGFLKESTILFLRSSSQPQNERLPGTERIKHEQTKVDFIVSKFMIFALHVILSGQKQVRFGACNGKRKMRATFWLDI